MSLFAGLYTEAEARHVVEAHLLNADTFASPYGIRTTSRAEESYRPHADGFSWRGPIWIGEHWFIYRGLIRYGYKKEAEDIRAKSIALLEKSGFRECFNPETGEGFGANGFTWGALVLDMIEA
jgi:glycogen debranching enzyme